MSANQGRSGEPERTIADVMANLTLGGGRSRRRRKSEVDEAAVPARDDEPDWPDGDAADQVDPAGPATATAAAAVRVAAAEDPSEDAAAIVRPYAWTRGRTKSNFELRVETMVSTSERAGDATAFAESEHRAIGALCHDPRSVAEVATLLGVPLGVAKVLLGDMAQLGLVAVHKTATGGANKAHLVLMERVLSGLRRL
ncbi:DUF742 domain-containing protein [Actinokineospora cianjurensis]|uniref:Uncharacterized protein DUF742 n=1 Tax=Actinokineospora cianjurensis TaxID=585224 RepID=A0A421BD39_9PSEU|nr:DUF742 domain-containing protein [Actinokineospora cianjurensis]RLK62304.1 uncharacterized protein DUF742 [Actinokineospora cianjurensis]